MTADAPAPKPDMRFSALPTAWAMALRKFFPLGKDPVLSYGQDPVITLNSRDAAPLATKPRRKPKYPKPVPEGQLQNTKFMLRWCRKHIANFATYEAQAIASKGEPAGGKK